MRYRLEEREMEITERRKVQVRIFTYDKCGHDSAPIAVDGVTPPPVGWLFYSVYLPEEEIRGHIAKNMVHICYNCVSKEPAYMALIRLQEEIDDNPNN